MTKKNSKVAILGFGFSGLSAAWAYLQAGFEVEVFEKDSQVGGLLQTKKSDYGIIEQAANAVLLSESVQEMATSFGIKWAERKKVARKKWVYTDKPRRWPLTFSETAKSLVPLVKLARSNQSLRPKPMETVSEWGLRNFGNSFFVNKLLGPALQGVYAQGPENLSASLCLKSLFQQNKIKTKGSFAPKNGMSEFFTKGLLSLESNKSFRLNLNSILNSNSNEKSKSIDASIIVDTRPDCSAVKYISVSSVTLFFEKENRPRFEGFGCLFAGSNSVLGVLFNSDIFEGRSAHNTFSETWIVSESFISDESTLKKVVDFRNEKFGIYSKPIYSKVTHWSKGIPSYSLELESLLQNNFKVETNLNSHKLIKLSNYTGDIGLNKILEKAVYLSKKS